MSNIKHQLSSGERDLSIVLVENDRQDEENDMNDKCDGAYRVESNSIRLVVYKQEDVDRARSWYR